MSYSKIIYTLIFLGLLYIGVFLVDYFVSKIENKPYQRPSNWVIGLYIIGILVAMINLLLY